LKTIYPVQKKEVIWRRIGDTVVVIKEDGLSSHTLNKTAAFIWELCNGNLEVNEIADKLHERFDVSLEDARNDVSNTIEKLTMAGILKKTKGVKSKAR
jgi:LDH2 family malate/lactate/ureidoglycolate dehydrogenase